MHYSDGSVILKGCSSYITLFSVHTTSLYICSLGDIVEIGSLAFPGAAPDISPDHQTVGDLVTVIAYLAASSHTSGSRRFHQSYCSHWKAGNWH